MHARQVDQSVKVVADQHQRVISPCTSADLAEKTMDTDKLMIETSIYRILVF